MVLTALALLAVWLGLSIFWMTYAMHRSLPGGAGLPAPRFVSRWLGADGERSHHVIEGTILGLTFAGVAAVSALTWLIRRWKAP